jgi:hypothetical protein
MTPFPMNQFSNAVAVVVKNNIAYVANGLSGLMIVDFNRPDKPIILSLLDIEGFSKGVYVKGDRAFVVSQAGGVSVVNAENLKAPRLESYMAVQGLSRGFQVDGGKFYLPRNNLGVSMLPVPLRVEEIDRKSSNHILCTLPMVEFSGQYDLQVGTQDGLIVHEGVINYQ